MRKDSKKTPSLIIFPALKAEVRELVHLPRRSHDVAGTYAYEPTHVQEIPLGNLYMVGHIEDAAPQEQTLLNTLFLEARRTYYHGTRGLAEERFQYTLKQLNRYLQEHTAESTLAIGTARCHVHIMVIADGTVLVSEIGSVFSYLVRDGVISSVSHKNPPQLASTSAYPFTHLIRGRLLAEDRILAITPHFIDTALVEKIDSLFLSPPLLEELAQHSRRHASDESRLEERAAAGIIVRISQAISGHDAETPYSVHESAALRHAWAADRDHRGTMKNEALRDRLDHARSTTSMLHRMLERMIPAAREVKREFPETAGHEQNRTMHSFDASRITRHFLHWYLFLPLVSTLLLGSTVPFIFRLNAQTRSRLILSDTMDSLATQIRTVLGQGARLQERALFAQSLESLNGPLFEKSIPEDTRRARSILESGIQHIDRSLTVQVTTIADFSKLAIEFSPEIIFSEGAQDYLIAQNDLAQMLRITNAQNPRLVITGIPGTEKALGTVKTGEQPERLAMLGLHTLGLFEPQSKTYFLQDTRLPKSVTEPLFLASGLKELFAISANGPVAHKTFSEKKSDAFISLPFPKAYQLSKWRGGAVISPSLYLLSDDGRLIEMLGGKIKNDAMLPVADISGKAGLRLRALEKGKELAILDEEQHRIIILTPKGELVRQYRNNLFSDMKDIIESPNNTLLVLTGNYLLRFPLI